MGSSHNRDHNFYSSCLLCLELRATHMLLYIIFIFIVDRRCRGCCSISWSELSTAIADIWLIWILWWLNNQLFRHFRTASVCQLITWFIKCWLAWPVIFLFASCRIFSINNAFMGFLQFYWRIIVIEDWYRALPHFSTSLHAYIVLLLRLPLERFLWNI